MRENALREVLNRLRWGGAPLEEPVTLEVRTRERGEERVASVAFEEIAEVLPAGVNVADGTFLPYHRVVRVKRGDEVLWQTSRERRR